MKILSMTATFGKLSHDTIRLEPGMNVIHAPNEWGKSTWCAFIVAMLYGIETRQQTTKTALADKERFAPWSGEPMSGRMEINWNGRDITIERSTKGRVPFGQFRAYETATGLDIPELTNANCGQTLLGVERSVFQKSGFVRLQDMPVTQDEFLRRRLNNLVTTGDENSAADTLGKQLKELKNKVRHNRTGQLPQAEYERDQLRSQIYQRQELQSEIRRIQQQQAENEQKIQLLQNHTDHLKYEAAKQGVQRIQAANDTCARLEAELTALEESCAALPSQEAAAAQVQQGQTLQAQRRDLLLQNQQLPPAPTPPEVPALYRDMTPEQAITNAQNDFAQYQALDSAKKKQAKTPLLYGILAAAPILILLILRFAAKLLLPPIMIVCGGLVAVSGIVILLVCAAEAKKRQQKIEELFLKYPGITPSRWISSAEEYAASQQTYRTAMEQYAIASDSQSKLHSDLEETIRAYAVDRTLEDAIAHWEAIVQQHSLLSVKHRELQNAKEHASALQDVATTAPEPTLPDELTLSASETQQELQAAMFLQKQLGIKLGQCIGQAEAIGQEDVLKARLDSVSRRISRLEDYYYALEMAQDALYQASNALQRRFAPRISKRAQELFSRLTNGRYQRITLSDDLSISASAENEDTLRGAQWRSDGTVDQLYLSLRLAVAGEVTPEAPLILDDALLRFDDDRLKLALDVLKEEAQTKQVILFSCQSREQDLIR